MGENTNTAHDLYNALVVELNGMVDGFVSRYGWHPITGDYGWHAVFACDMLIDGSADKWEDMNALHTEINARHKAMMLADGSESERVFDEMHAEYLDELANV